MGNPLIETSGTDATAVAPVCVVIPCYCCAEVLERAVASVLAQELLPAELILVEDNSPDGGATRACVERIVRRNTDTVLPGIRAIYLEENLGPGGARTTGWNAAQQTYVAFLDADDAWHHQKISLQYDWMIRHPECCGSGHDSIVLAPGQALPTPPVGPLRGDRARFLPMLFRNKVLTRTVMLRRDVPQRFAAGARFSEDYALWLDLVAAGKRIDILEATLAFSFRSEFSAGGQSGQLWRMEVAELAIYRRLFRERKIGRAVAGLASGFSLLKFVRRLVIERLRALRR